METDKMNTYKAFFALITIISLSCTACKRDEPGSVLQAADVPDNALSQRDAVARVDAAKGNWPKYRGVLSDGYSLESDWSGANVEVVWRKNVGTGFSTVSVVDGLLYTLGNVDGDETVWCLDAATGDKKWSKSVKAKKLPLRHEGGPCATPTVDGDRVYTIGKEGAIFCLGADDGKVIWEEKMADLIDIDTPMYGFSGSIVILGNAAIIPAGRIVAVDKMTGKLLWTSDSYKDSYCTPLIFDNGGKPAMAAFNGIGLTIINPVNGETIVVEPWETKHNLNVATPIFHKGKLYISSAYSSGCGLFEFAENKLTEVYVNRDMQNHFNTSVLYEGALYGISGQTHKAQNCKLTCMNFASGKVHWATREYGEGDDEDRFDCGSLMMADGRLIVLSGTGTLLIGPASTDGFTPTKQLKVLEGRCWTSPVLANKHIYCRNADGDLVCVSVKK